MDSTQNFDQLLCTMSYSRSPEKVTVPHIILYIRAYILGWNTASDKEVKQDYCFHHCIPFSPIPKSQISGWEYHHPQGALLGMGVGRVVRKCPSISWMLPELSQSVSCVRVMSSSWEEIHANLAVSAQRHVKAPFISYLRSSGVSIRKVSNKQVFRDFLEKYTEILSKWSFSSPTILTAGILDLDESRWPF